MKKIYVFTTCFIVMLFVGLESAKPQTDSSPIFGEGKMTYTSFIDLYCNYPEKAVANKTEGTVIVNVKVNEKGENIGKSIKQSVSHELDAEALRVVGLFPDWTPAMKNGKAVASNKDIPFTFKLTDAEKDVKAEEKVPLYIVNGEKVTGNLNVDPNTITSIRVKKGKPAIDAYGSDASDGVVIITTR